MPDAWFKTPKTDIAELDRDAPEQRRVDAETTSIALYHYETCMFCARVRSVIERLELHIELRNIHTDREHLRDLVNSGGRMTVPWSSNRWGRGDVDVRVGRHYPLFWWRASVRAARLNRSPRSPTSSAALPT